MTYETHTEMVEGQPRYRVVEVETGRIVGTGWTLDDAEAAADHELDTAEAAGEIDLPAGE